MTFLNSHWHSVSRLTTRHNEVCEDHPCYRLQKAGGYSGRHELVISKAPGYAINIPACMACFKCVCPSCFGKDRGIGYLSWTEDFSPDYDYLYCTQCWENPELKHKVWWKKNYPCLVPVLIWFGWIR